MIFKNCRCSDCGEAFEGEAVGGHRVMCGDATSAEDVGAALDGVVPVLMVTDPPYGVDYDPTWRDRAEIKTGPSAAARVGPLNRFKRGVAVGLVKNDTRVDWGAAWALFPGSVIYAWHGGVHAAQVEETLTAAGFVIRAQVIWNKHNHAIGRGGYHWKHEPCWYAVRAGAKSNWQGARDQMTVWDIRSINPVGSGGKGLDLKVGHGTQKPVECMRRPIANNSRKGDVVYDPFLGSGTTIIAAEMMERFVRALELDPAYVDVAVRRWQGYAKAPAVRADGRLFDRVAA